MRAARLLFLPSGSRWWPAYAVLGIAFLVALIASFMSEAADTAFRPIAVIIIVATVVLYIADRPTSNSRRPRAAMSPGIQTSAGVALLLFGFGLIILRQYAPAGASITAAGWLIMTKPTVWSFRRSGRKDRLGLALLVGGASLFCVMLIINLART